MKKAIIFPCFNEENNLGIVLEEYIRMFLDKPDEQILLIVVSDGSTDRTLPIALGIQQRFSGASVQGFPISRGQYVGSQADLYCGDIYSANQNSVIVIGLGKPTKKVGAVAIGFQIARQHGAQVVGFVDTDNTIPAVEFKKLIDAVEAGADLALGSRLLQDSVHLNSEKDINHCLDSYRLTNVMSRALFDCQWEDTESGAKVLSQRACDLWVNTHCCVNLFFDAEMMALVKLANFKIVELPIKFRICDKEYVNNHVSYTLPQLDQFFHDHFFRMREALMDTKIRFEKGDRAIEIALIQLSYDGITTYQCGVGTVVRNGMKAIRKMNETFKFLRIKCYLITPNYRHLETYSATIHEDSASVCAETGGELFEICSQDDCYRTNFGSPIDWQRSTEEGAEVCVGIIAQNKYSLVIAHDTAFAQLPMALRKKGLSNRCEILWIPHSTSAMYDGPYGYPERRVWEQVAFSSAAIYRYKIGWIGEFILFHSAYFYRDIPLMNDATMHKLILIDWEMSGNNDPAWDLAYFSNGLGMGQVEEKIMLDAYHIERTDTTFKHRMEIYKPIIELWVSLWMCFQAAIGSDVISQEKFRVIAQEKYLAVEQSMNKISSLIVPKLKQCRCFQAILAESLTEMVAAAISSKKVYEELASAPHDVHHGLQYKIIVGDSHCLYRAVTYYLGHGEDVAFLRRIVDANLRANIELYREVVAALRTDQSLQEYIASIRNTPAWAGSFEINILMYLLNCPVVIIGPDGAIRNTEDIKQYRNKGEPVFIYYNGADHYDALILRDGYNGRNILSEMLDPAYSCKFSQTFSQGFFPVAALERVEMGIAGYSLTFFAVQKSLPNLTLSLDSSHVRGDRDDEIVDDSCARLQN